MSCHNVGFTVHDPDKLKQALAKKRWPCPSCGDIEFVQCDGARVVADHIYFSSICVRCDRLTGRSVRFYQPKDTYPPLDC